MCGLDDCLDSGKIKIINGRMVFPETPSPEKRNAHGVRVPRSSPLPTWSDYPSSPSSSSAIPPISPWDVSDDQSQDKAPVDVDLTIAPPWVPPVQPKKKGKGKQKRTRPTLDDCVWRAKKSCCTGGQCHQQYTNSQVYVLRNYFYERTQVERRLFAQNRVVLPSFCDHGGTRAYHLETPHNLATKPVRIKAEAGSTRPVCVSFWKWALGASSNQIYQPSVNDSTFPSRREMVVPLSLRQDRKRTSFVEVVTWLQDMAVYHEVSPDSDMIFLPQASRKVVYEQFKADMRELNKVPASKTYFLRVWRTDHSTQRIKLRKYLRFAKCSQCVEFRRLRSETPDRHLREKIKLREKAHLNKVRDERESYYQRQERARHYPGQFGSKIIDGSDNGNYALPYFNEKTYKSNTAWKIPLHVFGCLSHGLQPLIMTTLDNVKLGTNSTLEVLHQSLIHDYAKEGLPEVLYLQLDNTTRQCKSRFIMGFMGYLVHIGLFKEVVVSFLEVGHTHEDIDQLFSRISIYLAGHSTLSRHAFGKACQYAYTSADAGFARIVHRDRVANISHWLEPHLPRMEGITKWQQFRIFNRVAGSGEDALTVTRLQCRRWCSGKGPGSDWGGLEDDRMDSPIFLENDETDAFLAAEPFSIVPPPSQMSDKVTAFARINKDTRNLMVTRNVKGDDADDLDQCLRTMMNYKEPLLFDWDVSMYVEAWNNKRTAPRDEAEAAEAQALEIASRHHPVGSTWCVRSDFDDNEDWETLPAKDLRFFWICRVVDLCPLMIVVGGCESLFFE